MHIFHKLYRGHLDMRSMNLPKFCWSLRKIKPSRFGNLDPSVSLTYQEPTNLPQSWTVS